MNDLVNLETMSVEELMEATGQASLQSEIGFPELRINKEGETDSGQAIPVGSYFVYYQGANVYAKTVRFRPFINSFQYRVYNEQAQKYANRSIIFTNWNDEAIDELGGIKCGKVKKKELETLTEDQKAVQKKIRCNRLLFGLVSMRGVTADNKEVEIENFPVCWRTGGSNWMAVDDALESLTKRKLLMFNYWFTLSLKKEKTGGNSYYVVAIDVDFDAPVKVDAKEITEVFGGFKDVIKSVNKEIIEKYKAAQKSKPTVGDEVGSEFNAANALDAQFSEVTDLNDSLEVMNK